MVRKGQNLPLGSLRRRFHEDEDFRLNVTYAVLAPIYVGLIVGVFWWSLLTDG